MANPRPTPKPITPARKFRMLLHINPTRQRGKRTGSLAGASGWYMTFFAAGVICWILRRNPKMRNSMKNRGLPLPRRGGIAADLRFGRILFRNSFALLNGPYHARSFPVAFG